MSAEDHIWSFVQPIMLYHGKIIPPGFPYLCILLQGRPHFEQDGRLPLMERGKRAKIFAPFDALAGFDECIDSKRVQYCQKVELDEEEKSELNRRLTILHQLTYNSRLARINRVYVRVKYYVPCTDQNSFSYMRHGRYISASGIVRKVDMDVTQTITIDDTDVHFNDILSIEAENETLFKKAWEEEFLSLNFSSCTLTII
ncbi:MAG: YolD-like family protein [Clostridiales bacterium]|nr:YolD-like family protein [Clostridiales bacterium]